MRPPLYVKPLAPTRYKVVKTSRGAWLLFTPHSPCYVVLNYATLPLLRILNSRLAGLDAQSEKPKGTVSLAGTKCRVPKSTRKDHPHSVRSNISNARYARCSIAAFQAYSSAWLILGTGMFLGLGFQIFSFFVLVKRLVSYEYVFLTENQLFEGMS